MIGSRKTNLSRATHEINEWCLAWVPPWQACLNCFENPLNTENIVHSKLSCGNDYFRACVSHSQVRFTLPHGRSCQRSQVHRPISHSLILWEGVRGAWKLAAQTIKLSAKFPTHVHITFISSDCLDYRWQCLMIAAYACNIGVNNVMGKSYGVWYCFWYALGERLRDSKVGRRDCSPCDDFTNVNDINIFGCKLETRNLLGICMEVIWECIPMNAIWKRCFRFPVSLSFVNDDAQLYRLSWDELTWYSLQIVHHSIQRLPSDICESGCTVHACLTHYYYAPPWPCIINRERILQLQIDRTKQLLLPWGWL